METSHFATEPRLWEDDGGRVIPQKNKTTQLHSGKLTFSHLKMDGWNTSFPWGWPIFRGELLVSGSVGALFVIAKKTTKNAKLRVNSLVSASIASIRLDRNTDMTVRWYDDMLSVLSFVLELPIRTKKTNRFLWQKNYYSSKWIPVKIA